MVYLVGMSQKHHSTEAFEELAMPLFDPLFNFAQWLTQNREEAEDLVQETYTKALRGFASFEAGTNFRAWMYRILRNTFLTSRSGLAAMRTVALADCDSDSNPGSTPLDLVDLHTPESLLLAQADRDLLASSVERLPVHFREVLVLCEVEEMQYREIAETLGIPVGTVMSRLSRARHALRQELHMQLAIPGRSRT